MPIQRSRLRAAGLHSRFYTLGNIFRVLPRREDPWMHRREHARSLDRANCRLQTLLLSEQAVH